MSQEVTIIIPSHDRHHLLQRAISYYAELNFLVVIVDSSELFLEIDLPQNIKYVHLPGSLFSNKIHHGLSITTSPYACLCADDDFFSKSGLLAGKNFLQKHSDYASVQGNYIHFNPSNPEDLYNALYKKINGYKNDLEMAEQRVMETYKVPHIYALHRTNVLKSALNISIDIPNVTVVEKTIGLVTMCYGKHKVLPIFWSARDSERYTNYTNEKLNNYSGNSSKLNSKSILNKVITDWSSFLLTNDGIKLKKKYVEEVSDLFDDSVNVEELFDFSQLDIKKKINIFLFSKKLKDFIKFLLPKFFVNKIQLYNINKEKSWIKNRPGYPWSDNAAMKDWNSMVQVIIKFKDLN